MGKDLLEKIILFILCMLHLIVGNYIGWQGAKSQAQKLLREANHPECVEVLK